MVKVGVQTYETDVANSSGDVPRELSPPADTRRDSPGDREVAFQ